MDESRDGGDLTGIISAVVEDLDGDVKKDLIIFSYEEEILYREDGYAYTQTHLKTHAYKYLDNGFVELQVTDNFVYRLTVDNVMNTDLYLLEYNNNKYIYS